HFLSNSGLTQHNRNDGVITFQDSEAGPNNLSAEMRGVFVQLRDNRRVLLNQIERLDRSRYHGWRHGVGKSVRAGFLPQKLDQLPPPGDKTSRRASQRLPEGSRDDVDLSVNSQLFRRSSSGFAEHAGRV